MRRIGMLVLATSWCFAAPQGLRWPVKSSAGPCLVVSSIADTKDADSISKLPKEKQEAQAARLGYLALKHEDDVVYYREEFTRTRYGIASSVMERLAFKGVGSAISVGDLSDENKSDLYRLLRNSPAAMLVLPLLSDPQATIQLRPVVSTKITDGQQTHAFTMGARAAMDLSTTNRIPADPGPIQQKRLAVPAVKSDSWVFVFSPGISAKKKGDALAWLGELLAEKEREEKAKFKASFDELLAKSLRSFSGFFGDWDGKSERDFASLGADFKWWARTNLTGVGGFASSDATDAFLSKARVVGSQLTLTISIEQPMGRGTQTTNVSINPSP
jgi:hypothetical protein